MKSVWVFQDLMGGIVRIFAREEDAKKFARERVNEINNWTTDEIEEALAQLGNEDYVEDFIYLTERSFED